MQAIQKEDKSMRQSPHPCSIETSRDAVVGASLHRGSKRRRMLLAGLTLIAAVAPPAAGAAYGGNSPLRRTADVRKEQIEERLKRDDGSLVVIEHSGLGLMEIYVGDLGYL
jgi:hypothetical protein